MITILTHSQKIYTKEYLKNIARVVARRTRGPSAVTASLQRGLDEINASYQIDPSYKKISDAVNVLSGTEALRDMITLKQKGVIKKLAAGPNIIVRPQDAGGVITDHTIDAVIVPSQWVKDYYISLAPQISEKIRIWPAGVQIPEIGNPSRSGCLIYKKNISEELYAHVIDTLEKQHIKHETIVYGNFKQEDYHAKLKRVRFMIYLQEVESQGLALQEAWAHDVPTLVWNKGSFTYPNSDTVTGRITAPYLTPECGMEFASGHEFENKLEDFTDSLDTLSARTYCSKNLSDKVCAQKYVSIIESL